VILRLLDKLVIIVIVLMSACLLILEQIKIHFIEHHSWFRVSHLNTFYSHIDDILPLSYTFKLYEYEMLYIFSTYLDDT